MNERSLWVILCLKNCTIHGRFNEHEQAKQKEDFAHNMRITIYRKIKNKTEILTLRFI